MRDAAENDLPTLESIVKVVQRVLHDLSCLGFERLARVIQDNVECLVDGRSHRRHEVFIPVHVDASLLLNVYACKNVSRCSL